MERKTNDNTTDGPLFGHNTNISGSKIHIGTKNVYGDKYIGVKPTGKTEEHNSRTRPPPIDEMALRQACCNTNRVQKDQLQFVSRYVISRWQELEYSLHVEMAQLLHNHVPHAQTTYQHKQPLKSGKRLTISKPKLSFIFADYSNRSSSEVPLEMLLCWSRKTSPHDTIGELSTALDKEGFADVAVELHRRTMAR